MEKINLKNLDKSSWELYRFEEIAKRVSETVDPNTTELEVYVGLEHIDPQDIHIRRFGTPKDVSGGKLKCYPGDVIFGKRRAYQRKAAVVEFEGICSAHAFVFRANADVIDPKLFPFFLHSDQFMHRMVDISVGGLSPTINWSDLKHQQFLLPPKAEQSHLAELFWAMDEVIEKDIELLKKLNSSYSGLINHYMIHGNYGSDGDIVKTDCGLLDKRIGTMLLKGCLLEKPMYGANAASKPFETHSPRYIRITDIDEEGCLVDEDIVSIDTTDYGKYILKDNDFLFARTGNTVGKTLIFREKMGNCVFAGYLIRFRLNQERLLPKFLFYFTKSLKYEAFKRKLIKIGAQPNINSEEYQTITLPALSIQEQEIIIEKIDAIRARIELLQMKILDGKSLQKTLINQIF